MKRIGIILVLLTFFASAFATAEGGGGIEYIGNLGSDWMPGLVGRISGQEWLDSPSGSVAGFGAFGYGVSRHNFKVGGFGFGFLSGEISKILPVFGAEIIGLAGGFGGVILGSQHAAGPVVVAFNTRLGAGGIAVRQTPYPSSAGGRRYTLGTAGFYGGVDLEAGFAPNRNMLISFYAGVSGILAFTFWEPPLLPLAVPNFGVRLTWGRFR